MAVPQRPGPTPVARSRSRRAPVVRGPWAERRPSRPLVRLEHLWLLAPLVLVFSYTASMPIVHSDLFYNLALGRLIATSGQLITSDPLTAAPTREPFFNQPWLAQLLFYAAWQLGGYAGIMLQHALALTSAFALLAALALGRTGRARLAAGVVLVALLLAGTNLSVRPQAFSFPLFALTLLLLCRHAERGWQLWLVAPALALWANLHGAFLLGLGLVGIFLAGALLEELTSRPDGGVRAPQRVPGPVGDPVPTATTATVGRPGGAGAERPAASARARALWRRAADSRRVRRLLLLLLLGAAAVCLNPAGPRVYEYFFLATGDPIARTQNLEWRPTALDGLIGGLFFASLPPLVALLVLRRERLRATEALLLLAFFFLALLSVRNVAWWGFVLAATVVLLSDRRAAARPDAASPRGHRVARAAPAARPAGGELGWLNVLLAAALLAVALAMLPFWKPSNPLLAPALRTYLDARHPTAAAEFLARAGARGTLFTRMEWGGYLGWLLWPELRPWLDARIELHPTEVWRDYFRVLAALPGWEERLDATGAAWVLLERAEQPDLVALLGRHPAWRKAYEDQLAVVFERVRE